MGLPYKLTPAQVIDIRRCRRMGIPTRVTARRLGVAHSSVWRAGAGETYEGLPGSVPAVEQRHRRDPMFEAAVLGLTWEQARQECGL